LITVLFTIWKMVWISKERLRKYLLSFRQKLCQFKTPVNTAHWFITLVEMGKFKFRQYVESQPFWISIGHILVTFTDMSLNFPSWRCPFNSKFQNAKWYDVYSVYKINTDIHLMCELHVTTEQDVVFLMLTYISSQIILREFCLMSLLQK